MTHRLSGKLAVLLTITLMLVALIPWIAIQWNRSVNGNVAWLSLCAERWLAGSLLSEGCYDTNPPMSVLLYTPPVIFHSATGMEIYFAIYALTLALIVFSTSAIWITLKGDHTLVLAEKMLWTGAYLLAVTVLSSISFADKDHIIAIGLPPLLLLQRAITNAQPVPALTKYPALLFGSICLLVKPHYAIIPVALLLHRLIKQRKMTVIFNSDTLIMTGAVLAYTAALLLWFQDFLQVMLPDIIRYYLPYNNPVKTWADIKPLTAMTGLSLLGGYIVTIGDREKQNLLLTFNLAALGCLMVYAIQMKGLSYQLLPFYAFLVPSLALSVHAVLNFFLKSDNLATSLMIVICIAGIYFRAPLRANYPSHEDYRNASLTKYLKENCEKPCSYLVTHENMEIVSQTAFYAGGTYATRFPGFWYIAMLEGTPFPGPAKERRNIESGLTRENRMRFAGYTAQDLERFAPNVMLILTSPAEGSDSPAFDYFDYFSQNPEFQKQAEKYEKIGIFKTDRAFYFRDTRYDYEHILTWDVYKRKTETQSGPNE